MLSQVIAVVVLIVRFLKRACSMRSNVKTDTAGTVNHVLLLILSWIQNFSLHFPQKVLANSVAGSAITF
uniref:Putative secreted protein n=1 Tax=Anopheles marajoara TaxID=58244 RepID=A0A2M4CEX4_9DIPT